MTDVIDLFAGPGGWDIAARDLGLDVLGVEFDPSACATRRAAGLGTVEADVRTLDPLAPEFAAEGFIASPPCQTFSAAGKGAGRAQLYAIIDHVYSSLAGIAPMAPLTDERTALVLEPLRWIMARHEARRPYRWVALEQVVPVLPIWEAYAEALRGLGYNAVAGIVNAEQYGVPQTRRRAVLLARLDGPVALPTPTHSRYHSRTPEKLDEGVAKWVSMAEALGWADDFEVVSNYGTGGDPAKRGVRGGDEPSATITSKSDRAVVRFRSDNRPNSATRDLDQPPTILGNGARGAHAAWVSGEETRKVTHAEAATLQTFPAGYPWQGNKGQVNQQIGNAVPPLLARALLEAVA